MPIPLKLALFDRASGTHSGEQLVVLDKDSAEFTFDGFAQRPILSINRTFSAPVSIDRDVSREDLVFLAAKDDDPFARYEAMQELMTGHLVAAVSGEMDDGEREAARTDIAQAMRAVIEDDQLDDLMRGELMVMPGQTYVAEQLLVADPGRIHAEREALKADLGTRLAAQFEALYERTGKVPFSLDAQGKGARKVKTLVLAYAAASDPAKAAELAAHQYDGADNMTDRQGALMVLAGLDSAARTGKLLDFYNRYAGNALVIDKWFALQASSLHPHAIEHVKALREHPDFTLKNPNRVRSLYMAFAANPQAFHGADGEGYRMLADLILELDPINAQTAARFVPPLGRWQRIEEGRAKLMREALERIAKAPKLSRDTYEQVTRSLG
jgi:aminopeptidase N